MINAERRPSPGNPSGADDQHRAGEVDTEDTGTATVMAAWRSAVAISKRENQARRARVLADSGLAQRLKEPPLRLADPLRWNGFVPPQRLPEECCTQCQRDDRRCNRPHRSRANDSPVRRQLVDIAAEAMRREATSGIS